MKKAIKKSVVSTLMVSILLFSLVAFLTPLVLADRQGVGKYVDIEVMTEGGHVILTKLSSGETWQTDENGRLVQEKVGAGTVKVEVINVLPNYFLDYWEISLKDVYGETIYSYTVDEFSDEFPSPEFKTAKGITYVKVYFVEIFTVTAEVSDKAPNGVITIGGVDYTHENPFSDNFREGTELIIQFTEDVGYHISAITLNGAYFPIDALVDGSLTLVVNQTYGIVVFFSEEGFAYVPEGDAWVYLTESVSLQFIEASAGFASGIELERPEIWGAFTWDIGTLGITYDGATIILELEGNYEYGDNAITKVVMIVANDAFYCDVDGDLSVTAADLSLVANYNKATETNPNEFPYDPLYDTNRDGEITQDDVHRVNEYKGTPLEWESLVYDEQWTINYDPVNNVTTVTINPGHFSIFRAW